MSGQELRLAEHLRPEHAQREEQQPAPERGEALLPQARDVVRDLPDAVIAVLLQARAHPRLEVGRARRRGQPQRRAHRPVRPRPDAVEDALEPGLGVRLAADRIELGRVEQLARIGEVEVDVVECSCRSSVTELRSRAKIKAAPNAIAVRSNASVAAGQARMTPSKRS